MGNVSESSHSSPEASHNYQAQQARKSSSAHPERRPCDSCRRRKSRCSREAGQPKCVLCTFHHRECTYVDEPQRRKRKRLEGGSVSRGDGEVDGDNTSRKPAARDHATNIPFNGGVRSLLDRTLGLHRTTHSKHIGASSLPDAQLLELLPLASRPGGGEGDMPSKFRRVDSSTIFISRQDNQTLFSADDEDDLEAIEAIVRPYGPALVSLYFRIVHPSYPILHKGVFLEKYARTYKEFSPPLLAAVYVLAMDWWEYDRELSPQEPPDGERLIKAATKTLTSVIHRPKLSTLQAGLLLLQRSGGDSWVLTSQVVAVGEELGLHLDCSSWNIPEWEKGLRRRITWAVYMQDKWGALIHGRPSHITPLNWQARRLRLEDFPESAADEDDEEGSTEVEKGRRLFMHLTVLTEIMAEALDLLYGGHGRQPTHHDAGGVQAVLETVKPVAMKLRDWAAAMPAGLRMEDVKPRKLCSNGYLHLSYFATEIMIHRYIVRAVAAATTTAAADASADTAPSNGTQGPPPPPPQLRTLCRTAAKARLDHAVAFVESLRPEHLQGFWWFASSKCLALIGVYGALLWATSDPDDEAEVAACRRKLEDFRWSLKVRARSSSFLASAIREMDETLEDLDMTQRPRGPSSSSSLLSAAASAGGGGHAHSSMSTTPLAVPPDTPTIGFALPSQGGQRGAGHAVHDADSFDSLSDFSTSPGFLGMGYDAAAMSHSLLMQDAGDLMLEFTGLEHA